MTSFRLSTITWNEHLKKIVNSILFAPFTYKLSHFVLIFFLTVVVVEYSWLSRGFWTYSLYVFCNGFLCSWLLTLPFLVKSRLFRYIYGAIIYSVLSFFLIINLFCIYTYNEGFNLRIASIIFATTPAESIEFIESYFSFNILIYSILIVCVLLFTYYIISKAKKNDKFNGIKSLVVLLFISFIAVAYNPMSFNDSVIGNFLLFLKFKQTPDLRVHTHNLNIKFLGEKPHKIVVIINESISKSHCSFASYQKRTTPFIDSLIEQGKIVYFDNVESAETNTMASFKGFMSFYDTRNVNENDNWWELITIPEILKASGYYTRWISCQGGFGHYISVPMRYGQLCDELYTIKDKYSSPFARINDSCILNMIEEIGDCMQDFSADFIHLIGCHLEYKYRYPREHSFFKEDDYNEIPEPMRKKISEYDNALLYNDFILSRLIEFYNKKEAVIIIIPDHGQDLYESSKDYCGHGRNEIEMSAKIGKKIPLLIYFSDEYIDSHSELIEDVIKSRHEYFNTNDFPLLLMKLSNITLN